MISVVFSVFFIALPTILADHAIRTFGFATRTAVSLFDLDKQNKIRNEEQTFLSTAIANAYKQEPDPTLRYPFIFFHQRKAGGTSVRETLKEAGNLTKLNTYVICSVDQTCDHYSIPIRGVHAVYAGHIPWGEVYKFNRFGPEHNRDKFSCLTNFREPVSRLISCVEYRFQSIVQEHGCLSNISTSKLIDIITTKTDEYGVSCLNEPFRILSGIYNENVIDNLGIHLNHSSGSSDIARLQPKFHGMESFALQMTLHNVAKCGVMILEENRNATDFILQHRFPFLHKAGAFRHAVLNELHVFEKCPAPTAEQIDALEKLGALERLLYDMVVKHHHELLKALHYLQ